MGNYVSHIDLQLLTLLACVTMLGCQTQDTSQDWVEQSPFRDVPKTAAEEVIVVSCRSYPLYLPSQLDMTTTGFWRQYGLAGVADQEQSRLADADDEPEQATSWPAATPTTFADDMVRLWQYNGLNVAVAPLSAWAPFRKELLAAGARMRKKKMWLITNSSEQLDIYAYPLDKPSHLFLARPHGLLDGQTLEPGNMVFRVSCIPRNHTAGSPTYMKLTPVFQAAWPQQRFGPDQFGTMRRISELPEVTFDFLALQGVVPRDHFICIVPRPQTAAANELGRAMLTRTQTGDNEQLAIILLCQVKTGEQLKSETQ